MSAAILTEEFNLAELQKELATIQVNAHGTASCTVNPPRPHIRLDLRDSPLVRTCCVSGSATMQMPIATSAYAPPEARCITYVCGIGRWEEGRAAGENCCTGSCHRRGWCPGGALFGVFAVRCVSILLHVTARMLWGSVLNADGTHAPLRMHKSTHSPLQMY